MVMLRVRLNKLSSGEFVSGFDAYISFNQVDVYTIQRVLSLLRDQKLSSFSADIESITIKRPFCIACWNKKDSDYWEINSDEKLRIMVDEDLPTKLLKIRGSESYIVVYPNYGTFTFQCYLENDRDMYESSALSIDLFCG